MWLSIKSRYDLGVLQASAGRSHQPVLSHVKDPPSPKGAHQMNRPHNYSESAYFIHQRYEDTALVIFQQNAKKKKDVKHSVHHDHKFAAHHPLLSVQTPPPPPRSLSSGQGHNPGKTSAGLVSSDNLATFNTQSDSPLPPASPLSNSSVPLSLSSTSHLNSNESVNVPKKQVSDQTSPVDVTVTAGTGALAVSSLSETSAESAQTESDPKNTVLQDSSVDPLVQSDTTSPSTGSNSLEKSVTDPQLTTDTDRDTTEAGVRNTPGDVAADGSEGAVSSAPKDLAQDGGKTIPSAGDVSQASNSSSGDGVSGSRDAVEFGRFGSSGVVARRRVTMTKADSEQTQSTICALMWRNEALRFHAWKNAVACVGIHCMPVLFSVSCCVKWKKTVLTELGLSANVMVPFFSSIICTSGSENTASVLQVWNHCCVLQDLVLIIFVCLVSLPFLFCCLWARTISVCMWLSLASCMFCAWCQIWPTYYRACLSQLCCLVLSTLPWMLLISVSVPSPIDLISI